MGIAGKGIQGLPSHLKPNKLTIKGEAGYDAFNTVTYNGTTTTVVWTTGNLQSLTFGAGNIGTLAFTNPTNPGIYILKLIQDSTGSRTVTAWDSDVLWAGGTAPTISTGANDIDIVGFLWDGTNYHNIGVMLNLS